VILSFRCFHAEYDLLTVGDDVVFGSRSVVLASDADESLPVVLEDGAMLADRCVLLPGVVLGRQAVLGSGGIGPKSFTFPPGSAWVGCQDGRPVLFSAGDAQAAMAESTMRPFGRAFYHHEANYFVYRLWQHVLFNVGAVSAAACFWILPLYLSFRITTLLHDNFYPGPYTPLTLSLTLVLSFGSTFGLFSLSSLAICVVSKWLLLGRRETGVHSWDVSSYCQRWQLYLAMEEVRRVVCPGMGVLDFIAGSAWLVYYFRALGSKIGRNVALYPKGADPMMTEPDLVTIEDGACVDDASLIGHINTRGEFCLNRLHVGKGCVLRCNTRLLSGASMEDGSMLLEHTLIMSGDTTERNTVWQGWPGKVLYRLVDDSELESTTTPFMVMIQGADEGSVLSEPKGEVDEGDPQTRLKKSQSRGSSIWKIDLPLKDLEATTEVPVDCGTTITLWSRLDGIYRRNKGTASPDLSKVEGGNASTDHRKAITAAAYS
jgi:hypothetical protein